MWMMTEQARSVGPYLPKQAHSDADVGTHAWSSQEGH